MRKLLRFRNLFLIGGSLIVTGFLFYTDPDSDMAGTKLLLLSLASPVLAVMFAHAARKALFDYPEGDVRTLFNVAKGSPVGAGLALLAVAIVIYGLLGLFGNQAHADVLTTIPKNAHAYLPALKVEQQRFWANHPRPAVLAGLIEHESCLTLTHRRCWNPASQLKTAREEGAGLGQITRAYRPDGTLRFDALQELKSRHPALREWTWANVYQRPDLQLRAVVLMSKENYTKLHVLVKSPEQTLAFADAAYNGGLGGVMKERRACGLKKGCDPDRWFNHVENVCLKSKKALYGSRSACDINRHHVVDVLVVRTPKYERIWS